MKRCILLDVILITQSRKYIINTKFWIQNLISEKWELNEMRINLKNANKLITNDNRFLANLNILQSLNLMTTNFSILFYYDKQM